MDEIRALLGRDEPVRWVFTGDSITHGAAHTIGWRDYTELFDERARWELRRTRETDGEDRGEDEELDRDGQAQSLDLGPIAFERSPEPRVQAERAASRAVPERAPDHDRADDPASSGHPCSVLGRRPVRPRVALRRGGVRLAPWPRRPGPVR